MRALSLTPLHRFTDLAPLVLRLGIGLVFFLHGLQKLTQGPSGFAGMLTGLGTPAPEVFAWLVTIAELVGGALLIIGFLTRLATIPLIIVMLGAIVMVKSGIGIITPQGAPMPGAELDIALLAGLAAILLLGPGRFSVDHAMKIERGVRADRREPVTVGR